MPNNDFLASSHWLHPRWPAPAAVKAGVTLRTGGMSAPPYDSWNLGDHVGDDPAVVSENRRRLGLRREPVWLKQVHGQRIIDAAAFAPGEAEADGAYATAKGVICAVLTADCLPLLLCDRQASQVAAVHAGWRGLADGVIEAALNKFNAPAAELLVWLGPAIGPDAYEVGDDVRAVFMAHDQAAKAAFRPVAKTAGGKWLMDIYTLARQRLAAQGVAHIFGGDFCTYHDKARFYSYRRDGVTGRMASLIWLEETAE